MNKKYLNKDSATDVLSFALDQDFQTSSNLDQTINLGDVFICREMAKAKEHEINFLIVHGFLHLIGLDHSSLRQSQKWDKIEKKILPEYFQYILDGKKTDIYRANVGKDDTEHSIYLHVKG